MRLEIQRSCFLKNPRHHLIQASPLLHGGDTAAAAGSKWEVFVAELRNVGIIAAPMAVVTVSQTVLRVVAMMMVGQLGELALAAAAVASPTSPASVLFSLIPPECCRSRIGSLFSNVRAQLDDIRQSSDRNLSDEGSRRGILQGLAKEVARVEAVRNYAGTSRERIEGKLWATTFEERKLSISWGGRGRTSTDNSNRVYVGNLAWGVDNLTLETLFSEQGNVKEATVVYDRESGRSRGFGFVTYSSAQEVDNVIKSFDGMDLNGRTIRVSRAEARPRREY